MRGFPFLIVLACCTALPAVAQVSVDLHALQSLPATNPSPPLHRAAPRPPRPKVTLPPTAVAAPTPVAPPPVAPVPAVPPAAVATAQPVPPIAAAQAVEVPVGPPPAAPGLPQTASVQPAPEAPKPATANLRIPFDHDEASLSKEATAAIEGLLHTAYATGAPAFTVIAYAAGSADDPSSARRLSLARAMATRDELMSQGVPSRRITVRALGSQAGDGPPDRVDITAAPSDTP